MGVRTVVVAFALAIAPALAGTAAAEPPAVAPVAGTPVAPVAGTAVAPVVTVAGDAAAAAPEAAFASAAVHAAAPRRHAIYVELFGRGGLWGVGYDYLLRPRFAIGATASFYPVDGERVTSFSPYASAYPIGGPHNRWFVQVGPQIVNLTRPSPVPEWSGTSSTGVGASLASGFEHRGRLLLRVYAMGTAGKGGVTPWMGLSVGVAR